MPTDKPRFTITVDEDLLARIEDFKFSNRYSNQTKAVIALIDSGLKALALNDEKSPTKVVTSVEDCMQAIKECKDLDDHGKTTVLSVLDIEYKHAKGNVTIFPDPKMPTLEKNIASRDHHGLHVQTEEEKRREADLLKNLVGPDLEKQ